MHPAGPCPSAHTAARSPVALALTQDGHESEGCVRPSLNWFTNCPVDPVPQIVKGPLREECSLLSQRKPPPARTRASRSCRPAGGAWLESLTCSGLLGYRRRRRSAARVRAKQNLGVTALRSRHAPAAFPTSSHRALRAQHRRPRRSGPERPMGKARGMGTGPARPPGPLSAGGCFAFWAEDHTHSLRPD